MLTLNELKAFIEHEKKNLAFYALFFEDLNEKMSVRELERHVNFHLDRLIDLLRLLKEGAFE